MRYMQNYGDDRQTAFCAYCGGARDTMDHVPPRVFLVLSLALVATGDGDAYEGVVMPSARGTRGR
jgi:hypothetical protein